MSFVNVKFVEFDTLFPPVFPTLALQMYFPSGIPPIVKLVCVLFKEDVFETFRCQLPVQFPYIETFNPEE